jgi:cytochrome c oxidase assembly protein subunit 15
MQQERQDYMVWPVLASIQVLRTMHTTSPQHRRAVQLWLFAVAALMVVTLVVGGATRLTESGLSIVEWKPVTGVLPPMSQAAWQAEFDKYKEIPQYRELNRGMGLEAFKTIYWWEWSHRMLGRLVGAAFLIPFVFFLWRGWIEPRLKLRLWLLFGSGALLGAVGWWMVSSGLAGRVSVSQYRLGFHLTLACAIYSAILWTALQLSERTIPQTNRRLRVTAAGLLLATILQIYLGALVAGLNAGLSFNTWPLIDGTFIPSAERLWFETPAWRNLFENALTVQFNHRMVAYALWLAAVVHAVDARNGTAWPGALTLAAAMTVQAIVGIATLLHQAPIGLALLHQAMAIVVLTIAVFHAVRITPERSATRFQPAAAASRGSS